MKVRFIKKKYNIIAKKLQLFQHNPASGTPKASKPKKIGIFLLTLQIETTTTFQAVKASRKYRIRIEDESRLRDLVSISVRPWAAVVWGIGGTILLIFLGALLVMATPLRTLLPGYLKKGERSATEEGLLRIDSIRTVNDRNNEYLTNILTVLDTDRKVEERTDSIAEQEASKAELPADSLLPTSPREIDYINRIQDREKYNLTILAPLAGEQLQTYPVTTGGGEFSQATSTAWRVLMPKGAPVCAIADGRVITVQNPAPEGGSAVIIQHDHGFATRYSHLGTVAVKNGSHVEGGEVIALGSRGGSVSPGWISMEMWHDGVAVDPTRYVP